MEVLCQTCGADPRGSWGSGVPRGQVADGTCPDCGHSLAAPFNRAVLNDGDPAVEYEFEDWDAEDRAAAADALTARIVPFRWEPGLVLAVAAHRESEADAVLDELEAADAVLDELEAADAVAATVLSELDEEATVLAESDDDDVAPQFEENDAALPEGDEDDGLPAELEDDWGQGEDAFAALGNLFDAADRLFHTPTGTLAANDLREAGTIVRGSQPPYGFDPQLWRRAGEQAAHIEALLTEGSNEDIKARAQELRDLLAPHV